MGDDGDLFRKAVGPVRPVRGGDRRPPAPTQATSAVTKPPAPPPSAADKSAPTPAGPPSTAENSYLRPGQQRRTLRKLDGTHFAAQESLDLHHLNADAASRLLERFLEECLRAGITRVRIIHGKGQRSADRQPVLKPLALARLRQHPAVLAYRPAGSGDGGGGATRVLLKQRGRTSTD